MKMGPQGLNKLRKNVYFVRSAHAFGRSVLFIFSNLAAQSGRTMARTGLRMMPTFPSSSLKFRTAGFPQYGFKAGLQVGPSSPDTDISYPSSLLPPFVLAVVSIALR